MTVQGLSREKSSSPTLARFNLDPRACPGLAGQEGDRRAKARGSGRSFPMAKGGRLLNASAPPPPARAVCSLSAAFLPWLPLSPSSSSSSKLRGGGESEWPGRAQSPPAPPPPGLLVWARKGGGSSE